MSCPPIGMRIEPAFAVRRKINFKHFTIGRISSINWVQNIFFIDRLGGPTVKGKTMTGVL